MAHRRYRRRPMAEINVVPYIDVMLVLLVIFMITAPLMNQGVEVSLPQAPAEALDQNTGEPLQLTVDGQGRMYLNLGDDPTAPLDESTLVARTAAELQRRPKAQVLVRGDAEAEYGSVVRGMVLLQQAGAQNIGLITQPPASPTPTGR